MPGKLLKKLFKRGKKKPKSKEQLKKERDAWHASDEYKLKVHDYRLKNKQGMVWVNKGTKNEKLIPISNIERQTRAFHTNRKYKEKYKDVLKKKRSGGAVGPNGVL
jgi:hypothetical protein